MTKVLASGAMLVVGIELLALLLPDRRFLLWLTGAALATVLFAIRWVLQQRTTADVFDSVADERRDAMQRWLSRTETLVGWADSNRADWDRHLRPMLARQFELATTQKKIKDPDAFHATGRMLFGPQLWEWVDPDNVARRGDSRPGPGRAALHEILLRLEQI